MSRARSSAPSSEGVVKVVIGDRSFGLSRKQVGDLLNFTPMNELDLNLVPTTGVPLNSGQIGVLADRNAFLELRYCGPEIGWGVFATKDIPSNTKIAEYSGEDDVPLPRGDEARNHVLSYARNINHTVAYIRAVRSDVFAGRWSNKVAVTQLLLNIEYYAHKASDMNEVSIDEALKNAAIDVEDLKKLRSICHKAAKQVTRPDYGASVYAHKQGDVFARHINHAPQEAENGFATSNIIVALSDDSRLICITSKEIKAGEQLFEDYGPNYDMPVQPLRAEAPRVSPPITLAGHASVAVNPARKGAERADPAQSAASAAAAAAAATSDVQYPDLVSRVELMIKEQMDRAASASAAAQRNLEDLYADEEKDARCVEGRVMRPKGKGGRKGRG